MNASGDIAGVSGCRLIAESVFGAIRQIDFADEIVGSGSILGDAAAAKVGLQCVRGVLYCVRGGACSGRRVGVGYGAAWRPGTGHCEDWSGGTQRVVKMTG